MPRTSLPRSLFVTTALPYANGPFHIGHIMEYIQADIWVRFQRMQGHTVHFVGADDAHGAPIMLAAEKAGKTPEAFIADIQRGRRQYLDGFHLSYDNWHSTHSRENTELSQGIYRKLKAAGLVYTRPVEQYYDPVKGRFLADRYIKGECPNWHSTHSRENTELSQGIYRKLKAAGLVYTRPVEQYYDPVKGMFLADRSIKGECP